MVDYGVLMSSVPVALSAELVRTLATYVLGAGYTENNLRDLGLTRTPWNGSELQLLLSRKIAPDSSLFFLIRLFFFGEMVESALALSSIPKEIIETFIGCGMIECKDDHLVPTCMLVHFDSFLIACDSVRRVQAGIFNDLVLGVNKPTQILGNCMVRVPEARAVLDLGTGCGTLGFQAAQSAARVIGSDVNRRALEFAQFNAALNGIKNFEVRRGDRFEPVREERFDLIVSNPPFFLRSKSKLLFTDNDFALDSFVESLARQSSELLNEGGYFQMLCEWVEIEGEPWRDRIRNWFSDSGCDVLVMKEYEILPADYTVQRATESMALHGVARAEELVEQIEYFEARKVKRIHGGLVTARKSHNRAVGEPNSRNWFVFEDMGGKPSGYIGDLVLERFASEDLLTSENDSRLLTAKPRVSKGAILVWEAAQESKGWKTKIVYLEQRSGLTRRLGFNSEIAELVGNWDGSQELDFLITTFARKNKVPKKQAAADILALARRLASLSLITFV